MNKITIEKCPCGHASCSYYHLVGIGSFYQGTGFEKEDAQKIADLLNNHGAIRPVAYLDAKGPGPIDVLFYEDTEFGTTLPDGTKFYLQPASIETTKNPRINLSEVALEQLLDCFDCNWDGVQWNIQEGDPLSKWAPELALQIIELKSKQV